MTSNLQGPGESVSRRIGKDTVGVSTIGALTRLAPLLSTITIAAFFGTCAELDVYYLTLVIPIFLSGLVGMAITSVFVPLLVEEEEKDPSTFPRLLSSLFSYVLLIGLGMTLLYAIVAPMVMPLLGGAFDDAGRRLSIRMSLLLSPVIVLTVVRCFLTAVFHSRRQFALPTTTLALTPAVMIAAVFAFFDTAAIFALIIGNVAGHLLEVTVLVFGLVHRKRFPRFSLRLDPRVKRIFAIASPQVLSGSVLRLNPIIDRTIASLLAAGSISALVYAERMQSMPQQILSLGFFNVLLAHWSFEKLEGGIKAVGQSLARIQRVVIAALVPLVCFLWLFREPVISSLLERGSLNTSDAGRVASIFGVYVFQIVPIVITLVYVRAMLVMKETVFLMRVGLFNAGSNVTLNCLFVFGLGMGVEGIALATVVTSWIVFVIFNFALKQRLGYTPFRPGRRESIVVAVSTIAAAAGGKTIWDAGEPTFGSWVALLLAAAFFFAIYAFSLSVFRDRCYLEIRRILAGR